MWVGFELRQADPEERQKIQERKVLLWTRPRSGVGAWRGEICPTEPSAQAGIKIAGRNSNNLRYADDTTLMAESKEELKSLLMKVKKESGKVGLKLNIQ